jgi:hypothetical protein
LRHVSTLSIKKVVPPIIPADSGRHRASRHMKRYMSFPGGRASI